MSERPEATKVFHISLDEPLEALAVEDRYRQVLLVVTLGGSVVGQIWSPRLSVFPADLLARLIASKIGELVWHGELDVLSPQAHGRRVAEQLPNATFELVEGKGHMLYDAWAEAFAWAAL